MYSTKGVSQIVFNLLKENLISSDSPLKSFVLLNVFKQWLIERIEIIENATPAERYKIYDPNSFMMVSEDVRESLMTDVMDSLYTTHTKFL